MWLPRLVAWLAIIGGLLLLLLGLASVLTGAWLAVVQAVGAAIGALLGGSILLVLLDIAERLGVPGAAAPRTEAPRLPAEPVGQPWWERKS